MKKEQMAKDQKILAESKKMTDAEFLESMSRMDSLIDHEPDGTCGHCHHQFVMAQVARDMVAAGETENVIDKWSNETERRWQDSKFFKLWNDSVSAGLEPSAVFEERGWEP